MTGYRLIGVADDRLDAAKAARIDDIEAVGAGGLTAFLTPAPRRSLLSSRKARARELLAFERSLEALLACGPFLPGADGARFDDAAAAEAFLASHEARLRAALSEHAATHQYQVMIAWEPKAMLAVFAASPRWRGTLQASLSGAALGEALADGMEAWRGEIGEAARAALRPAVGDMIALPLGAPSDVANLVVQVAAAETGRFDAALEAFDDGQDGRLRIRQLGPLPPCAFASVETLAPDAAASASARGALGVGDEDDAAAIRAAYLRGMKSAHPDVGGAGDDAARLTAAYEALSGASLPSGVADCRIGRAGEARRAA